MSKIPALTNDDHFSEYLAEELKKGIHDDKRSEGRPEGRHEGKPALARPSNSNGERMTAQAARVEDHPSRVSRSISGGFKGLGDDLDQHARQWKNSVRLLEQLRPQMEAAEAESSRLQASLARIAPEIAETSKSLTSLIDAAKSGDLSGDLGSKFSRTLAKFDELERLSEALTANHLALQSTWEQYARAVLQAQRLRDGLRPY